MDFPLFDLVSQLNFLVYLCKYPQFPYLIHKLFLFHNLSIFNLLYFDLLKLLMMISISIENTYEIQLPKIVMSHLIQIQLIK